MVDICRRYSQMHFPDIKMFGFRLKCQQGLSTGWIDNNLALVWVMTWASYQIRKTAGCACTGNAGNVFPTRRLQRKPLVSDPDMHHGTCVTHVPWCMSGSLLCGGGENVPGIPGACAPAILRIWQEAHGVERATTHCRNWWWLAYKGHQVPIC